MFRISIRALLLLGIAIAAGCGQAPSPSARQLVTATRPLGAWQGTGSQTIGFVSDSGRFRVVWEARDAGAAGEGTFRLSVNSAVSGRPIQLVADQRGGGRGATDVIDQPRVYNLMIDSTAIEWSVSVDELVTVDAGEPSASGRR